MKRALIMAAAIGSGLLCTTVSALDEQPSQPAPVTATVANAKPDTAAYPLTWCLVSGETFGEMGEEAVTIVYHGRELKFCCKNCIGKFEAAPVKYLTMLDSVVASIPSGTVATTASDSTTPTTLTRLDWCIVSGEDLGGDMGEPVQYTSKGRTYDLCCNACKKLIDNRAGYYSARLDSALAGQIKQPGESGTAKDKTH